MSKKVFDNAKAALDGLLKDNLVIMAGGFGLCGIPENCITAVRDSGVKNLTVISNNCGVDDFGLGIMLKTKQIKKMLSSYVGENKTFETQFLNKELELEFNPQGTLAERIRAGGAGIPAFYTATGVGTIVAEGKETREFNGRKYVMETGLWADLAIIKAWKGDKEGNLIFRKTARNFNSMMVTAAGKVVVEVEELVETGSLLPDSIRTPGIFVDRIFQGKNLRKTYRTQNGEGKLMAWSREEMCKIAAEEFYDGIYANLGIGMPTEVANFVPKNMKITLHSENGMLGMGEFPLDKDVDADLINAGKQTISETVGCSYFDSATSFGMVRGGHIDLTILGALEVAENGDLANWMVPGKMVKGMGGAMDLVAGVKRIVVLMEHNTKTGGAKLLKKCTLPLTGVGVVNRVITELGVFDIVDGKTSLSRLAPGVSQEEIKQKTEADFTVKL